MNNKNNENLGAVRERERELHFSEIKGCNSSKLRREARGITLIALIVTIIVHCDKAIKYSNNNGFLLSSI